MADNLGLIIDEPWNAGIDLPASQAWLTEIEGLALQGYDVASYLERAKDLVRQAEDEPQLLPASAGG
jgi:hypothetical protein